MSLEPVLAAEGVVRSHGGGPVVDVERVALRAGEVLALLGPNGAGKSTLMRILAGLERPDAGRVLFRGRPVEPGDPGRRRACAVVFQRPYLWSGRVRDNVEYGLRVRGVPRAERRRRADATLDLLGLSALADAPVDTLSGGEARRVALARALVLDPECLLLDEPASDLDVIVHQQLLEDLERAARGANRAVLLVTHVPSEAFALGDRIAILERGRIVQSGTPEEIFETPATAFAASFTGAEFLLRGRVARTESGTVWVELEGGVTVEARGQLAVGTPVRVAYRPEDVIVSRSETPPRTSARNRFEMRIAAVRSTGSFVRLRLSAPGLALVALITRHSLEDLELDLGTPVVAQVKATALHAFASV